MVLSYRMLSYDEYKKAILSLLNDFSAQNRTRLLLAIEVCEELPSNDRLYRIEQSLDAALWEFDEAIELGFNKWKDKHLIDRNNAIIYHEQNSDECSYDCEVCKLAFRWKT